MPIDAYDDAVDELFTGDPAGFVSLRDRLAKELRSTDREAAAQIGKLRKPTRAAWALNSVSRARPDDIEQLADPGTTRARSRRAPVRPHLYDGPAPPNRAADRAWDTREASRNTQLPRRSDAVEPATRDRL